MPRGGMFSPPSPDGQCWPAVTAEMWSSVSPPATEKDRDPRPLDRGTVPGPSRVSRMQGAHSPHPNHRHHLTRWNLRAHSFRRRRTLLLSNSAGDRGPLGARTEHATPHATGNSGSSQHYGVVPDLRINTPYYLDRKSTRLNSSHLGIS